MMCSVDRWREQEKKREEIDTRVGAAPVRSTSGLNDGVQNTRDLCHIP